jgi:hypothetical protein
LADDLLAQLALQRRARQPLARRQQQLRQPRLAAERPEHLVEADVGEVGWLDGRCLRVTSGDRLERAERASRQRAAARKRAALSQDRVERARIENDVEGLLQPPALEQQHRQGLGAGRRLERHDVEAGRERRRLVLEQAQLVGAAFADHDQLAAGQRPLEEIGQRAIADRRLADAGKRWKVVDPEQ